MATRFYFPTTRVAEVSPAYMDQWTDTDGAARYHLSNVKGSNPAVVGTAISWTAGLKALDRQYVSSPLPGGIVFNSSVAVKCQMLAKEAAALANANAAMAISVCSEDGAVQRAVLLSLANYSATELLDTGYRNKIYADGDVLTGAYTTVKGDRLVVEIGYGDSAGTTPSASITWGGETGADLPENETATSGANWIEFSTTFPVFSQYGMLSPVDVDTLELAKANYPLRGHDEQDNAIASASLLPHDPGGRVRVIKVDASYSVSTVSGKLTVYAGDAVLCSKYIHGSGAFDFSEYGLPAVLRNQAITVKLAASGTGGQIGTVSISGFFAPESD